MPFPCMNALFHLSLLNIIQFRMKATNLWPEVGFVVGIMQYMPTEAVDGTHLLAQHFFPGVDNR